MTFTYLIPDSHLKNYMTQTVYDNTVLTKSYAIALIA